MHARRVLAEKSEQCERYSYHYRSAQEAAVHGELKLWLETSVSITLANSISKKPFIWLESFLNEIAPEKSASRFSLRRGPRSFGPQDHPLIFCPHFWPKFWGPLIFAGR